MDRLGIYNEALRICGERKLASLTESREPRHLLDDVWAADGVKRCLEAGQWQFAMRTAKIDPSASVTPTFGFRNAYDKPDDFVRTAALCSDEYFKVPLLEYTDELQFWFADVEPIYVRYISNGNDFGNDLSMWPGSFSRYVSSYFAWGIVTKLTQDDKQWRRVASVMKDALTNALSKDAMAEPTQFPPPGNWVKARTGNRSSKDRGSRSNLIG